MPPEEPAVPDPQRPDPAGQDPDGEPTGLELARSLAARLTGPPAEGSARSWARRVSRAGLARRAAAAGLSGPVPTSPPRPGPRAAGRVGGLADQSAFTGPGPDRSDPTALGAAVGAVLDQRGWREQVAVHAVLGGWESLVGPDIAAHCRPEGFADGLLRIHADSTAWATQLRLLAPRLRAALDDRLGTGTVAAVEVRGPAAPSWRHGPRGLRDARGPRDTYG